ncbi:MAG: ATP-binding cassette domain-containing protein [Elusimicrobiota bacterium]
MNYILEECILDVRKLNTYNPGSVSLKNVDFKVFPSEVHAIIGERGAGKELLLNTFTGQEKRIDGRIFFRGVDVTKDLKIGRTNSMMFLLEEPILADGLTVAENICIMKEPQGIFRFVKYSKMNSTVKKLLAKFNLQISEKESVSNLSLENRKIIELIKLFLYEPELIIMFEPTAYLGLESQKLFSKMLDELKKKNTGILYITNKWDEAFRVADRISVLYVGSLIGEMGSKEAKRKPEKLLKMLSGMKDRDLEDDISEHFEKDEVIEAVFKATEYLTSDYEINDVLKMLEDYACKIMESEGCYIYLVDEKTHTVIDTIKFEVDEKVNATLKTDSVFKIMNEKRMFYTHSDEESFKSFFEDPDNVNAKTVIFDPVIVRSHYTALIQTTYLNRYEVTEKKMKFLQTLSRQAALAIDNTRLMGSSVLLQESHHRIKNNLQTIISLINMQKRACLTNPSCGMMERLYGGIVSRVKSIAAVHDLLSKDELGRSIVNLKELVETILQFYVVNGQPTVVKELDDLFIPYDKATNISLVINELVNNCIKHAFIKVKDATINLSCKILDRFIQITIEDNGIGLSDDTGSKENGKLGLSLVRAIVENQFFGEFKILSKMGTRVEIIIPKTKLLISQSN